MKPRRHPRIRQFIDIIREAMRAGMSHAEAMQRMTAKRIPTRIQWRICDR